MSLSSRQLDAFLAVMYEKSFTKAAASLCITQSALSQRIAQLEEKIGLLFIRGTKTLQLTLLAEELFLYCQQRNKMEAVFLEKKARTKNICGILNIAAFSTAYRAFIFKRITPLMKRYPEIELNMIELELRDLAQALLSGKADYILSTQPIYKRNIKTILIYHEDNILVESSDYISPSTPIYLDHDPQDETTLFFLSQQKNPATRFRRHYLDNIHLIIEGVKLGLGQAVLPIDILETTSELKAVKGMKPISLPVYLMYYEQAYRTPLQDTFISYMTE